MTEEQEKITTLAAKIYAENVGNIVLLDWSMTRDEDAAVRQLTRKSYELAEIFYQEI